MPDNNIAATVVAGLSFSVYPATLSPFGDYTKIQYPHFGGTYFCSADKNYGDQAFLIFDGIDGSGTYAQFGTTSTPLKNWALLCDTSVNENFQIYDSNGKMLFAVTGTGTTKVNKIGVSGTAPAVAINANAGTGATVAVQSGTDTAFQILLTAGSTGMTGGVWCHVTFATAFARAPQVVWAPTNGGVGFLNGLTTPLSCAVTSITANGFDFFVANGNANLPTAGQSAYLNFICIG